MQVDAFICQLGFYLASVVIFIVFLGIIAFSKYKFKSQYRIRVYINNDIISKLNEFGFIKK